MEPAPANSFRAPVTDARLGEREFMLRATGHRAQAVAVIEQATIVQPETKALLAGYGRALADNGDFEQAFGVLGRAHSPDNPDWRFLSVQGAVLAQGPRRPCAASMAAGDRAQTCLQVKWMNPALRL